MFFLACHLHRLRRPILPVLQERTATEATATGGASCVTWDRVATLSSYQISHLRCISAIREYRILKHRIWNCKVIGKYSLEHASQVCRRHQVPRFLKDRTCEVPASRQANVPGEIRTPIACFVARRKNTIILITYKSDSQNHPVKHL